MPFFDFTTKPQLKIWDGVAGSFYHAGNVTFGHVTLQQGTIIPEHSHVHEQWTHVLKGELEFTINGETKKLIAGMAAHMPSNAPHSVKAITECQVLDYFSPIREDFVELEKKS